MPDAESYLQPLQDQYSLNCVLRTMLENFGSEPARAQPKIMLKSDHLFVKKEITKEDDCLILDDLLFKAESAKTVQENINILLSYTPDCDENLQNISVNSYLGQG